MANFEIVALDPVTPQLRAPGAADNYTLPRHIAGANITLTAVSVAGTVNLTAGDNGKFLYGNSANLYLPDITTVPSGYNITVKNTGTGLGVLTLYVVGTQYIEGLANFPIRSQESFTIVSDGTYWRAVGSPIWISGISSYGFSRPTAANSFAVAVGYGGNASGVYSTCLGYASTASGQGATGGSYCVAQGNYSLAFGPMSTGGGSYATGSASIAIGGRTGGSSSVCLGIDSNSTSYGAAGSYSIAAGYFSKVSSSYTVALGPFAQATANGAVCIGASYNVSTPQATGISSIAIGDGAWATQQYSVALGPAAKTTQKGQYAFGGGYFVALGDSQHTRYVLRRTSTNGTPINLTTDSQVQSSNNQVSVADAVSAIAFTGIVLARSLYTNGAYAAWEISGMIMRGATLGSTVLVNSTVTQIANSAAYTLALSADTTNGALSVVGTGDPAFSMRWIANIECAYLAY